MSLRRSFRRRHHRAPRIRSRRQIIPSFLARLNWSRGALLAGTSAIALALTSLHPAHALQVGNSGAGTSAVTIAAQQAQQAAQQAQQAGQAASQALSRASHALQSMQSIQAAARAAAQAAQSSATLPNVSVPNGIGTGGLLPNNPGTWVGAKAPTQSVDSSGQTDVTVDQTQAQAILNWTTFNVGSKTTLTFDQQGNSNWVALNRVDASTGPSQILGNIKADGIVLVINQSGIIFGGASQINVGSLVASSADITDAQFLASGIYSSQIGTTYVPNFTGAGQGATGGLGGKIIVEAGAEISTNAPATVSSGGGYVLMMGTEVDNAGSITTPKGQVELAAGQDFILRSGFGTDSNQFSTTRGNEIAIATDTAGGGIVDNTGLIFAQQGDITLAGHTIIQDGILLSTTSVNQRGTIHLLNSATDATGSVTLTANSVTEVVPELDSTDTALDSQRDALIASAGVNTLATGQFNNLSTLADRPDESRIEIVTGGVIDFQNGSLTQAQGGQVAASAGQQVFAESGSTIDVSGVQNVVLPMSANEILVNIQGNELRDSPGNRDNSALLNGNVWIDVRDLILVPAGTGGYATDRYYTPGGLLEVSGYLSNIGHTIGEWDAVGGTITLSAPEVVAQKGSTFNISGGSLQYQGGTIIDSTVVGSDGQVYNVDDAPTDLTYVAGGNGFIVNHSRAGIVDTYSNLVGGIKSFHYEAGYTVGRAAGQLILSTPTAVFEGDVVADVTTGSSQTSAAPAGVTDGYKYTQNTVPLAGTIALGTYNATGLAGGANSAVVFGSAPAVDISGLSAGDTLPAGVANTAYFDANQINAEHLGGVSIASTNSITVDAPLVFAAGGKVSLVAPIVDIAADITVPSGNVTVTNILVPGAAGASRSDLQTRDGQAMLTLEDGATIDVSGLWTNELFGSGDPSALAFVNGGNVTFESTQGVTIAAGSKIDVSSGAAILQSGKTEGGKGGNVTLIADEPFTSATAGTGAFTLDGDINAVGVNGGGTLTVTSGQGVLIGDAGSTPTNPGDLVLPSDYFDKGFSNYDITGLGGVTVADGAQVDVVEPVYQFTSASFAAPSGTDASAAMNVWLPPLFIENPLNGTLTQRAGASLALHSEMTVIATPEGGDLTVGHGASITVDPGQSITLDGLNQTTIDGTLTAHGGTINILSSALNDFDTSGNVLGHTLWIGGDATLDVSGLAYTAQDLEGRAYGVAGNGGSIQLNAGSSFLVIRPGAVLDADGASATIDANAGGSPSAGSNPFTLAGNGGSISLNSSASIYNDGTMEAHAGGANAAGGTFTISLSEAVYTVPGGGAGPTVPQVPSIITVTQDGQGSGLPDDLTPGSILSAASNGHTTVSATGLHNAGFDNLSFNGADVLQFDGDVKLTAGQSISFTNVALSDTLATGHVTIDAPYVLFAGHTTLKNDGGPQGFLSLWHASTTATQAIFDVDASLIDFKADTYFGASGTVGGNSYDFLGFQNVNFTSQGDVRFLINPAAGDGSPPPATRIFTPGNLTFTAAQLYPVTGAQAFIVAGAVDTGATGVPTTSTSSITIKRINDVDPDAPLSVFGQLYLLANDIYQGGIVRAPLGIIVVGAAGVSPLGGINLTTQEVDFGAGSITSVSAAGLTIPYGGTTDGLSYLYAGAAVNPIKYQSDGTGRTNQGINIASQTVDVQAGATLDLSGGGNVTGRGFISGSGGSVDVLTTPLVNANPNNTFSSAGDKVYAIVPSYGSGYAPIAADNGAGDPMVGQQITIPAGVPGLPAGTYTLLPSTYALLPGAFRVEVGGSVSPALASFGGALGNGSYSIAGYEGIANTSIKNTLPTQFIVTAANDVRNYSQYDEESYSDFFTANAATFGQVRPVLPTDAKMLLLDFIPKSADDTTPSFTFDGTANLQAAPGGFGGTVLVNVGSTASPDLEIYAPGAGPTAGFSGISLSATALDALEAPRLLIGGVDALNANSINIASNTGDIFIREGVTLSAGEVILSARNNITVEQGATISTVGQGPAPYDLSDGFVFGSSATTLDVSNGDINFTGSSGGGAINIAAGVSLYSEGTLAFATNGATTIDPTAHYGTKILELAGASINIGDGASLGATVPDGIGFDQALFDQLVAGAGGGAPAGVPGLQQLVLGASKSINFYGTTGFDASGTDIQLVFTTPAIYGYGTASDHASITAGTLVWTGASNATLPTIGAGSPGSGTGTLDIIADTIILGYSDAAVPNNQVSLDRATYGFSTVNLTASTEIISNNKGSLSVYLAPGTDPQAVLGKSGTGGDLNIATPLLTGAAGSIMAYSAGGSLDVTAPTGATPPQAAGALGAEIDLTGNAVNLDTNVLLPSGKLVVTANAGDITLGAGANLDLSGKPTTIQDQTLYGFGGDVILTSAHGNIIQDAGSTIDVSAVNNDAGTITATATDAAAGKVALNGTLLGGSTMSSGVTGDFDGGFITISAQTLQSGDVGSLSSDFAALNDTLNTAGFSGSRSFDFKQGDLIIGDGVKANNVSVSMDSGSLTVTGTIDASGAKPGTIRLSAGNGLTLNSTAVLDVHGTELQVDSYGNPIDASNRGHIELTAAGGILKLSPGATMNLSTPDGVAYGDVQLNAQRTGETSGDVDIDASGNLIILGAQSIALNAFWTYNLAGGSTISQATLDGYDAASTSFINAALTNSTLQGEITGLSSYGSAFHLRPGVEITSSGDLSTSGDIDLSGYRYGPNAVGNGSGEPGVLIVRAGGNLTINGSITDGFATPPATPDDTNGPTWAAAAMLPAGSLSWSMSLVAGADLTSADTRAVQSMSALAGAGNLTLDDPHVSGASSSLLVYSVLRTGTGTLDLLAGGNFNEETPFGIYTAGTQAADVGPNGVDTFNRPRGTLGGPIFAGNGYSSEYDSAISVYQAWYPENGGDLLLSAQGNIVGYAQPRNAAAGVWIDSGQVGNWLWRQADLDGTNAAWWINFGSYVFEAFGSAPILTGFQGIGTLGGGNLTVVAGGNAGTQNGAATGGLNLAVASTGRALSDGTVEETGGGDLTLRVGGALNPAPLSVFADVDLNGTLTDLRGNIDVKAGSIGVISPFSPGGNNADPADPRSVDYRTFEMSQNLGGIIVVPGDGTVNIGTRGDLVLEGAGDAGMVDPIDQMIGTPYIDHGTMVPGGGQGNFTLWTGATAIGLFSAGGNVSPGTWTSDNSNGLSNVENGNFYPPSLIVEAASGSIYFSSHIANANGMLNFMELMPSATGQLSLLAANSIYGEGVTVAMSGADPSTLATPKHAAFQQFGFALFGETDADPNSPYIGNYPAYSPIAFGPDTPTTNVHANDPQPSLVYAGTDIVDLGIGLVYNPSSFLGWFPTPSTWYIAAEPFDIIAGRDIVGAGIPRGSLTPVQTDIILNNNPNDISVIRAGRDILYGAATIAGPGLLDVEAGRNFYAGSVGSLHSVGPLVDVDPSNRSSGAGIVLMAGVGPNGPDYTDFAKLYFNPANQLPTDGTPLDGSGKVVHTYDQELLAWLQQRFGYTGGSADALSYFLSLPVEQQGVFVRQVYYEELTLGGREESGAIDSTRLGSYLRGREAIAALFPETDANGQPIDYTGTITMFSGQAFYTFVGNLDTSFHSGDSTRNFDAGIHTDFGGDIQILNPGGQTTVGVEGFLPGADAGLITQGSGDIDIYSLDSLLLGQSRIMTTFGGDIVAWSADGDINAGRGSKTTTIFTPPRRIYDDYGNITLSPTVPSQGAGIATLNPIPEVPPGDIDLIAPLGTIDAGEAGIRVSGNVNLAALTVVNAANIQVQGTSTGIPTVSGPPVGALTAASNVVGAGQQLVPTTQANNSQPSVMIVEIIGYGGSQSSDQNSDDRKQEGQ